MFNPHISLVKWVRFSSPFFLRGELGLRQAHIIGIHTSASALAVSSGFQQSYGRQEGGPLSASTDQGQARSLRPSPPHLFLLTAQGSVAAGRIETAGHGHLTSMLMAP